MFTLKKSYVSHSKSSVLLNASSIAICQNLPTGLSRKSITLPLGFQWILVYGEADRSLSWFWQLAYKSQCKSTDLCLSCATCMTVLHSGLWLGQIAPTSNISFTCAQTSSTMGWGILWTYSLKGSLSTTLISCFARLVQPSSTGFKEKTSWYWGNKVWVATWFGSDQPSRPDKSSCWRSTSLLLSTNI